MALVFRASFETMAYHVVLNFLPECALGPALALVAAVVDRVGLDAVPALLRAQIAAQEVQAGVPAEENDLELLNIKVFFPF